MNNYQGKWGTWSNASRIIQSPLENKYGVVASKLDYSFILRYLFSSTWVKFHSIIHRIVNIACQYFPLRLMLLSHSKLFIHIKKGILSFCYLLADQSDGLLS